MCSSDLTGRRRAAGIAVAVFAGATALGALVAPGDSRRFWTEKVFEPTSPSFFSNQSLQGMLLRSVGPWRPLWALTAIAVLGFGLAAGIAASRAGDERRGVALVALTAALVSPISWIHHLVCVIPAFGVLTERARTPRRVVALGAFALFFTARLPYLGHDVMSRGPVAVVITDAYGLALIGLLVGLGDWPSTARMLRRAAGPRHDRVGAGAPTGG